MQHCEKKTRCEKGLHWVGAREAKRCLRGNNAPHYILTNVTLAGPHVRRSLWEFRVAHKGTPAMSSKKKPRTATKVVVEHTPAPGADAMTDGVLPVAVSPVAAGGAAGGATGGAPTPLGTPAATTAPGSPLGPGTKAATPTGSAASPVAAAGSSGSGAAGSPKAGTGKASPAPAGAKSPLGASGAAAVAGSPRGTTSDTPRSPPAKKPTPTAAHAAHTTSDDDDDDEEGAEGGSSDDDMPGLEPVPEDGGVPAATEAPTKAAGTPRAGAGAGAGASPPAKVSSPAAGGAAGAAGAGSGPSDPAAAKGEWRPSGVLFLFFPSPPTQHPACVPPWGPSRLRARVV
jgi:hypothetical protein